MAPCAQPLTVPHAGLEDARLSEPVAISISSAWLTLVGASLRKGAQARGV